MAEKRKISRPPSGLRRRQEASAQGRHLRGGALAACVVFFCLLSPIAMGQQPAPAKPKSDSTIAVIDIQRIFKNHARFLEGMQEWQAEVAAADADAKKAKAVLDQEAQKLTNGQLQSGTSEYRAAQDKVVVAKSVFDLAIKRKKDDLVESKAALYREVYGEIREAVDKIAAAKGISLVLQFDGEPINPDKPDDVLRVLGQVVFWHNKDRDITPQVLDAINRNGTSAHPASDHQPHGEKPSP